MKDCTSQIHKDLVQINEHAKVANLSDGLSILVYSNDHEPPHFHLGYSGGASIRIAIPDKPFDTIDQVKQAVLDSDKDKIPAYSKYFKQLIKTLNSLSKSKTAKNLTVLDVIWLFWDTYRES